MRPLVQIFTEVAPRYELVNHVLTFGLDIVWREKAARLAGKLGGRLWLDVCSGTGEMARSLYRRAPGQAKIVVADFCPAMVHEFSAAARKKGFSFLFTLAEAGSLPFAENTFDLVSIAFATRNIHTSPDALLFRLQEFGRVLRPGGWFLNLETSQPSGSFFRKLVHFYVRKLIRPVGFLLSGSKAAYTYLSSTICRFYSAPDFAQFLQRAGFSCVEVRPLFFGVAAIHLARKPESGFSCR